MSIEKYGDTDNGFFYEVTIIGDYAPRMFAMTVPDGIFIQPGVIMPLAFMPAAAAPSQGQPEASAGKIPEDAGADFREKRELSAMRAQLETAIRAENFEYAALLRDKIKDMEK